MKRSQFADETHWDLGAAFLSVRKIASGFRAAVAKLNSDGEYITVSRSIHRSRSKAINAGMRALRKAVA